MQCVGTDMHLSNTLSATTWYLISKQGLVFTTLNKVELLNFNQEIVG